MGVEEGEPTGPIGIGHSLCVGPDAEVIAEAGSGPELMLIDVAPERVARQRDRLPVLPRT